MGLWKEADFSRIFRVGARKLLADPLLRRVLQRALFVPRRFEFGALLVASQLAELDRYRCIETRDVLETSQLLECKRFFAFDGRGCMKRMYFRP